jgi:hypothetical protein
MWVENRTSPTLMLVSGDAFPSFIPVPGTLCERTDRAGKLYVWDLEDGWIDASTDTRVSIKALGAVGDGLNDDTQAIQAAIDFCLSKGNPATSTRTGLHPLYIPKGTYRITAPLTAWSVEGLRIYGDGDRSRIMPTATMTAALDLNGVAYSSFENFTVAGDATSVVTSPVRLYWDNTTAIRSTTQNTFRSIHVGGKYVNGFAIGSTGVGASLQVDNTSFYHCIASGLWTAGEATYWQNGFLLGTGTFGNNLEHTLYKATATANRYGVHVDASQAAIWGADISGSEVDIVANVLSYFRAEGIRSEGSTRFFESGGISSNLCLITLSDIDWHAETMNADGRWVIMHRGGTLILDNAWCRNPAVNAKIYTDTTKPVTVALNGLSVGGSGASPLLSEALELGANARLVCTSYTQAGSGGPVVTQTSQVNAGPSIADGATFRIPHGTAPTSPVNGDMWTTTAGLFVRINGSTIGPLS